MNTLTADLSRTDLQHGHADQLAAAQLLAHADVRIDGDRPWDIRIRHPDTMPRILARGSLGLGDSYMDGWWECEQIDEFIARVLRARLDEKVGGAALCRGPRHRQVTTTVGSHLPRLHAPAEPRPVGDPLSAGRGGLQ